MAELYNIMHSEYSGTGQIFQQQCKNVVISELVKNGQYAEAIVKSQAILSDFPKTTLAIYALYDLGSIYWYRLADQKYPFGEPHLEK